MRGFSHLGDLRSRIEVVLVGKEEASYMSSFH